MPGRGLQLAGYRFGFQNQEEDAEFWGGAVAYTYRIEDKRGGRFFSVDPLAREYSYYSPYSFSGNRVIDKVELEGLEPGERDPVTGQIYTAGDQEGRGISNGNFNNSQSEIKEFSLDDVLITAYRNETANHTLSQSPDPGPLEKWGQNVEEGKSGFLSRVGYGIVNSTWTGLQDLVPGVDRPRNLSGRSVSGSERTDGVVAVTGLMLGPLMGTGSTGTQILNESGNILLSSFRTTTRTFAAIKPAWNPLTQFTKGVIPKGTPVKFGIVGPQGLRYPGGSLQFIVPSKNVINQSSNIIFR